MGIFRWPGWRRRRHQTAHWVPVEVGVQEIGKRLLQVVVDGGHDEGVSAILREVLGAEGDITRITSRPWSWLVEPKTGQEIDPAALREAMRNLEPMPYIDQNQLADLQRLPLARIGADELKDVVALTCQGNMAYEHSGQQLPVKSMLGRRGDLLRLYLPEYTTREARRLIRLTANQLGLRLDPNDPLTRTIVGDPLY